MAENLNQALDSLAAQVGLSFKSNLLDPIQPDSVIAARKAAELKQFLETRKQVAGEQAKSDLLSGAALTGTNATPAEIAAFKPGLPLNRSTYPEPTPGLPAGTPDPALEADLQTQLRDEELNRAGAKNAPAVEAMRRSLDLHNAGLSESQIAAARVYGQHERLYGANADVAVARRDALTNILNDPTLDPMLKNEIAQNKVSFKSQRVKVQHKDGTVGYYDATPNLSGGYDYAQALDENGDPISAPTAAAAGNRQYMQQENTQQIMRVMFPGDPDAEKKALAIVLSVKGKSSDEARSHLVEQVIKEQGGRYSRRGPEAVLARVKEIWRLARPMEPFPGEVPAAPAPTAAPGSQPAGFPSVQSDADFLKLPSGARFIDPTGKLRRKP